MSRLGTNRGAAMLLALAALTLLPALAVGVLRAALDARVASIDEADALEARRLAVNLRPALLAWLRGMDAATEPFGARGFATIAEIDLESALVRVRAIDLSGRLRVDRLETFAAAGLPAALARVDPGDELDLDGSPNEPRPTLESVLGGGVRVLPPTVLFDDSDPAAGLWLTTRGTGELNVRAAPPALLLAALEGADPALRREAEASLNKGAPMDPDLARRLAASSRAAGRGPAFRRRLVPLTDRSTAFGFLIEVSRGPAVRRWWLVCERESGAWRAADFRRVREGGR